MNLTDFSSLWSTAILKRNQRLIEPDLFPWFKSSSLPPVIGFGLPSGTQRVDVATIALNPSDREITSGFLPDTDDPSVQWQAQCGYFLRPYDSWFNRAQTVIRSASATRLSYGGKYGGQGNTVHLDVSPLPTMGKFDKTYNEAGRTPRERERAQSMLKEDSRDILFPLLDLLRRENGLSRVIVFGFAPPNFGSRTMKDLWGEKSFWNITDCLASGTITVVRARPTAKLIGHRVTLGDFEWLFMSQGPSSRADLTSLERAAQVMSQRRWLTFEGD